MLLRSKLGVWDLQVKGRRLDVEGAIRTRSRAAAQAEQWQVVRAPVKIFTLLADMLIEAREGMRFTSATVFFPVLHVTARMTWLNRLLFGQLSSSRELVVLSE